MDTRNFVIFERINAEGNPEMAIRFERQSLPSGAAPVVMVCGDKATMHLPQYFTAELAVGVAEAQAKREFPRLREQVLAVEGDAKFVSIPRSEV